MWNDHKAIVLELKLNYGAVIVLWLTLFHLKILRKLKRIKTWKKTTENKKRKGKQKQNEIKKKKDKTI